MQRPANRCPIMIDQSLNLLPVLVWRPPDDLEGRSGIKWLTAAMDDGFRVSQKEMLGRNKEWVSVSFLAFKIALVAGYLMGFFIDVHCPIMPGPISRRVNCMHKTVDWSAAAAAHASLDYSSIVCSKSELRTRCHTPVHVCPSIMGLLGSHSHIWESRASRLLVLLQAGAF